MEVSGQLHAPAALPPEKEPLVHIGEEAGWAPIWNRECHVQFAGRFTPWKVGSGVENLVLQALQFQM
jgi:hypothetical protein